MIAIIDHPTVTKVRGWFQPYDCGYMQVKDSIEVPEGLRPTGYHPAGYSKSPKIHDPELPFDVKDLSSALDSLDRFFESTNPNTKLEPALASWYEHKEYISAQTTGELLLKQAEESLGRVVDQLINYYKKIKISQISRRQNKLKAKIQRTQIPINEVKDRFQKLGEFQWKDEIFSILELHKATEELIEEEQRRVQLFEQA